MNYSTVWTFSLPSQRNKKMLPFFEWDGLNFNVKWISWDFVGRNSQTLNDNVFALIFIALKWIQQICCNNLGFVGEKITTHHKVGHKVGYKVWRKLKLMRATSNLEKICKLFLASKLCGQIFVCSNFYISTLTIFLVLRIWIVPSLTAILIQWAPDFYLID